ncbi:Crp/Fnr family transcriptional regulator [Phenylobacterium sp. LjRoot225]|uniref:Crp/Fnr family transcriptional regulator n=1 Tax=Phenylobacterium sp. LjRoot225 TaxID=3342285 RepID=UPI003ECCE6C4
MAKQGNWLLKALEPDVRSRFTPRLRQVQLVRGELLLSPGETVSKVFFPEGALIGLISATAAGDTVQTAMVGWDGALGVFEACGTRQSAFMAEVQVEGAAWAMAATDYRLMYAASETLRTAVHKYVEILLTEARQFVACNALHSVEARLSRSVLEALDRSRDGRILPATQEVLAQMLGVQRTTVTAAIAQLQAVGAVRSTRGVLEVVDEAALEAAACCCRETLREARAEIYAADDEACDD